MIQFDQVSVTYQDASEPALLGADLTVPEGELCLLVGPSGAGKSTLLGTVSGLVPHFTGGTVRGTVTVAGRDTRTHKPRELADVVGTVGQDPMAHFVTDTVEDELAYGMESLGIDPAVMRRRVEETLDLLGLATLRARPLASLSGGQQQRVAIGSVLTPHPRVLVLDEPTSALDPGAAEEVLAVLLRLVHDLGTTVLMAEHRLERVIHYADQVLLLPSRGTPPTLGPPAESMANSPVRPPVVALGELAGWSPLPLSVRDARRRAEPLREHLAPPGTEEAMEAKAAKAGKRESGAATNAWGTGTTRATPATSSGGGRRPWLRRRKEVERGGEAVPTAVAETRHLAVRRGGSVILRDLELALRAGETVALMGRNGAGKSTLLHTLVGMHEPATGSVRMGSAAHGTVEPHRTRPAELLHHVGLVPADPRDLLYADTVAAECVDADGDANAEEGTCAALVTRLLPDVAHDAHPRDLSEGQRLALALAVVLAAAPPVLLLDEPTRGLDYSAKARLVRILRELTEAGHAVVLATHDVELAAELAHRVVILADGDIVADGPTADVVTASPAFAPQVAKILAPGPWLTLNQVRAALDTDTSGTEATATTARVTTTAPTEETTA